MQFTEQNYSYAGIIEALSGAPFDVKFISFDDIKENPAILDDIDVILNVGDAYTAYTGGDNWKDETVVTAIKRFVYNGSSSSVLANLQVISGRAVTSSLPMFLVLRRKQALH